MGSSSDDGGNRPSDGGSPDDLPDLPEEWGVIVIPDDLSELADEIAEVQAELRLSRPRSRWQRFLARPAVRGFRRIALAGGRAPAMIISLAVLVTIASLFASAWPGATRVPTTQRSAGTSDDSFDSLPALELLSPDGAHVPLRGQLPAVILLTDGCPCADLIASTVAAVPPQVAVVTVTEVLATASAAGTPPTGGTPQAQGKTVRPLRDPTGELRKSLKLAAPDGTATAVLVGRTGQIVRTVNRLMSVEMFRADLARL